MKTAIFDLDGTLVDTFPGIERSFLRSAASWLPDQAFPDVRTLIGPPVDQMFRRAWPTLSDELLANLVSSFRADYDAQGWRSAMAYPEVDETIDALHAAGVTLFVLTNKPLHSARSILGAAGLLTFFSEVFSPDSLNPPWPSKSDGAKTLVETYRIDTSRAFVVGDGADDRRAAESCGMRFIAASYGYGEVGDGPFPRIKRFSEITRLVL